MSRSDRILRRQGRGANPNRRLPVIKGEDMPTPIKCPNGVHPNEHNLAGPFLVKDARSGILLTRCEPCDVFLQLTPEKAPTPGDLATGDAIQDAMDAVDAPAPMPGLWARAFGRVLRFFGR